MPSTHSCIESKVMEFVNSWPNLGHILNVNRDDGADTEKIRSALCGQIGNVLCYFGRISCSEA